MQPEVEALRKVEVERLVILGYKPSQIAKALGLSTGNVLNHIEEIAKERAEKLAARVEKKVSEKKAEHVERAEELMRTAWMEMQYAMQAAAPLVAVKRDQQTGEAISIDKTTTEIYSALQLVASRWAAIFIRCEEFTARVDGSTLEADGKTTGLSIPASLLRDHDLHLSIVRNLPKEERASIRSILERNRIRVAQEREAVKN